MPATFTMAPSGARLPRSPTTPPVLVIGLLAGRTTSCASFQATRSMFSAMVRPVTVMQSPCRKPWSSSVFMRIGMPPASNMSLAT